MHQDHHIQCLQALYSVPSSLCPPGQKVEIRADSKLVRIYHRGQLIKTHVRQPRGGRATDPDDYPVELTAYTTRAPDRIKSKAAELGPEVGEFAGRLLGRPVAAGQGQAGQQAPAPGPALHRQAPGRRLSPAPGSRSHRREAGRAHPGACLGGGDHSPGAPAIANRTLRPARQCLRPNRPLPPYGMRRLT